MRHGSALEQLALGSLHSSSPSLPVTFVSKLSSQHLGWAMMGSDPFLSSQFQQLLLLALAGPPGQGDQNVRHKKSRQAALGEYDRSVNLGAGKRANT